LGGHKADGTAELVNAAGDCITDPYLCTIDIASAIDEFNSVILTLIDAFAETCNAPFITPVGSSSLIHVRNPNKLRQELRDDLHKKLRGKGSGGYFDYQPGGINKKSHGGHHKHHHAHEHHVDAHRRLQETIALANSSNLERINASLTEFRTSLKVFQVDASENNFTDLMEVAPETQETVALANSSNLERINASLTEFRASLQLFQVVVSENNFTDLMEVAPETQGVPTASEEDAGAVGRVYE